MQWNSHSALEGAHAFLGGSNYHWLNYDKDKLHTVWISNKAKQEGTELHALAKECIDHRVFLKGNRSTLAMYVNDGIRYQMKTEQPLVYSINCFGTADTIKYDEKEHFLRIHDLKTGTIPAHMEQLEIYAALFCLEYGQRLGYRPVDDSIELRIYQNDDVRIAHPGAEDIVPIMDKIKSFDEFITKWQGEQQ